MNLKMRKSFLSDKLERINLFVPILFLFATIINFFLKNPSLKEEKNIFLFIGYIVFFNHLHIFLTPIMLIFLPEFKSWNKLTLFLSYKTTSVLIFVFVIIFSCFIIVLHVNPTLFKNLIISFITVRIMLGFYHNLFQSFGCFLLYNKVDIRSKVSTLKRIYKSLFLLLWIIGGSNALLNILNYGTFRDSVYSNVLTFSSVLIALVMITITLKAGSLNQLLYTARLLLFALIPTSIIALTGYLAAHGLEYVMLYFQICQNSNLKLSKNLFYFTTMAVLYVCSIPFILTTIFPNKSISYEFSMYVLVILGLLELTHYFFDSILFRFSSKNSKKLILPLLLRPSKPDQIT